MKGTIVRIGSVSDAGVVSGWEIEGGGIGIDYTRGLVCGYTVAELREIAERNKFNALREWVRAEIDYALARQTEGADGYAHSSNVERHAADRLFEQLKSVMSDD